MKYFQNPKRGLKGYCYVMLVEELTHEGGVRFRCFKNPKYGFRKLGMLTSYDKGQKALNKHGYYHQNNLVFRKVVLISNWNYPLPYLNNVIVVIKYDYGYPVSTVSYDSLGPLREQEVIRNDQMDRIMSGEKCFTNRKKRYIFTCKLEGYEKKVMGKRGGYRAPKFPGWWKDTQYALGLDDLKRVYKKMGGEWVIKNAYVGRNTGRNVLFGIPRRSALETGHMRNKRKWKRLEGLREKRRRRS